MFDYFFKVPEDAYQDLLNFCVDKGLIKIDERGDVIVRGRGEWDYIGYAIDKSSGRDAVSGEGTLYKADQEVLSKDSVPLVHVNLRTEFDITEVVTPEELNKFFYVDAGGKMTVPDEPVRVFL